MAYARTFAETGILTQQPGVVPVEAVSNPTWTFLWAGLVKLHLADAGWDLFGIPDYVVATRALGLLFFVATLWALGAFLRAVAPERWRVGAAIAGTILAVSPPFVIWSVAGLENPIYGLCIAGLLAWIARASIQDRIAAPAVAVGATIIAFLAAATRPDGLIYLGVLPLVVLILNWRKPALVARSWLVSVLTFGVLAAPALYLRWTTYHALLANTAVAKPLGFDRKELLSRLLDLFVMGGWVLPLAVIAALVVWFRTSRTPGQRGVWATSLVMLVCGAFVYVILPNDWMGEYRFATPVFVTAAAVLGAVYVTVAWRRKQVIAGCLLVVIAATMLPRSLAFATHATYPGCYVADRYGRLYNSYVNMLALKDPVVMLPDVGGSLMTADFRIVDLAGLADKQVARLKVTYADWGPHLIDYVVDEAKPDLIAFGWPWDPGFEKSDRFMAAYIAFGSPGTREYVRRDKVSSEQMLLDLKALAARVEPQIEARWKANRLASCGPLVRGEMAR